MKPEGVWKPIAGEKSGVEIPPNTLQAVTFVISGDSHEVTVQGETESDKGTFTLDTSVSPKRMTLKGTAGLNQGKTIPAIYEMGLTATDEDTFRVCYDLSGKDYPKTFAAPKDTQLYLVGYRRQSTPASLIIR